MPRYLVERDFPDGLILPVDGSNTVGDADQAHGIAWVHSYVSTDKKKSYCVYDAPDTEAVRRVASKSSLPVSSISEIRVLSTYC